MGVYQLSQHTLSAFCLLSSSGQCIYTWGRIAAFHMEELHATSRQRLSSLKTWKSHTSYNFWIFAPCMIMISPCSKRILRTSFFSFLLLLVLVLPQTLTEAFGRHSMIELQPREIDATVGPRVFSPSSWYFNCKQRSLSGYGGKLTPILEFSK